MRISHYIRALSYQGFINKQFTFHVYGKTKHWGSGIIDGLVNGTTVFSEKIASEILVCS